MDNVRRYLGSDLLPAIIEAVEALQRLGYELAELEAGENLPIKAVVVVNPHDTEFTTIYWNGTGWISA